MAAYTNYYPNYYANNNAYNLQEMQNLRERLDKQITQMQNPQPFISQPPQIQQTFQLNNPQQGVTDFDAKYAEGVDDVKNTLTLRNTLFLTRDMSTMWMKDINGNIKLYSLTEIIERDEKDAKIDELTKQIEEMKSMFAAQLAQNQTKVSQTVETPKVKEESKSKK